MTNNSTQWNPGQSGNPNGRPAGSRNRRTQSQLDKITARGDRDPLDIASEIANDVNLDPLVRAPYVRMVLEITHSKMGTTTVPPLPIYIQEAISLPRPTSISQASENIGRLSEMKAQGQLDFATADSLIADQRVILNALVDEAKLLAATGDPNREQVIRIEGGLPELPGTNVIMPELNEHNGHEHAGLPAPNAVIDPPSVS